MSGAKLNAVALYAHIVVMAVLGFVINPFLVQYLGAANFGIWKSCLRILDLSTVADGRATQALKWVIAHQASHEGVGKRQRQIGASLVIWLIWLPLLLIAISIVVYALPWLINGITGDDVAITRWVGVILGINVVLAALLGVPDAVLFGTNQGYKSMVLTTLYFVLSNVAILTAAWLGHGLPTLAAIMLASSILNGLSTWLIVRKNVSWWGIAKPQLTDVSRFIGFSNWTLVSALVQLLMLSSELLLIGFLIDPLVVTKYIFNSYVIQFALSICLMTGSAVTPKLGALIGGGELPAARHMIRRTREILLAIMTVSGASIILLNRTFVSTWIGPDYYMGDTINVLMVVAFFQLALVRYDGQVQDVSLNIAKKVLICLTGSLVSMLLAALCYRYFRTLESLFIGMIIGRIPITLWLPRLVATMAPGSGYDWRSIVGITIVVGASILMAPLVNLQGWINLAVSTFATALTLSVATYVSVLSAETRAWLPGLLIPGLSKGFR